MKAPWTLAVALAIATAVSPALAQGRWRGLEGKFLPFESDDEVLAFLSAAEVVHKEDIPMGTNKPLKVLLEKDGVRAHAVFRTVNVRKPRYETGGKVYLDFHDSYIFECAAYEVSRLLGLDNVPPCVFRTFGRRKGTLQLWIEKAQTEVERRKDPTRAPGDIEWVRQQQNLRLFDGLIHNFDRNQGNMLIDSEWKLWFIDHTRSFPKTDRVEELEHIIWVERRLWEKLRSLDLATLEARLGGWVDPERIAFVLRRRDVLVRHLEDRITRLGEDVVVYDASSAGGG